MWQLWSLFRSWKTKLPVNLRRDTGVPRAGTQEFSWGTQVGRKEVKEEMEAAGTLRAKKDPKKTPKTPQTYQNKALFGSKLEGFIQKNLSECSWSTKSASRSNANWDRVLSWVWNCIQVKDCLLNMNTKRWVIKSFSFSTTHNQLQRTFNLVHLTLVL